MAATQSKTHAQKAHVESPSQVTPGRGEVGAIKHDARDSPEPSKPACTKGAVSRELALRILNVSQILEPAAWLGGCAQGLSGGKAPPRGESRPAAKPR